MTGKVKTKKPYNNTKNRSLSNIVGDFLTAMDWAAGETPALNNVGQITTAINQGIAALAAAGGGTLFIPPGCSYNEAGLVHSSSVTVLDVTTPGKIRVLSANAGSVLPINVGGFVIKSATKSGIFLRADVDGSFNAPFLQLLNEDTGQLAGLQALFAQVGSTLDIAETSEPAAPADGARLFVRDNGSGKAQLCVRFPSGPTQIISTQS